MALLIVFKVVKLYQISFIFNILKIVNILAVAKISHFALLINPSLARLCFRWFLKYLRYTPIVYRLLNTEFIRNSFDDPISF